MRGVVLCGGQSTRMGSDKGLLRKRSVTWAELAVSKLVSLNVPVVLSVNEGQKEAYSKIFSEDELIMDDECISVKGPLLGLLSVHQKFRDQDFCVLACDMIDMDRGLLQNLVNIYSECSFDAYVYVVKEKCQPLCAVYTAAGLKNIYDLHRRKPLKRFSMMYVLECIHTKYITAELSSAVFFNNYNASEELMRG